MGQTFPIPAIDVRSKWYTMMWYGVLMTSCHVAIITDSVVLWKIQKFNWLIPETK